MRWWYWLWVGGALGVLATVPGASAQAQRARTLDNLIRRPADEGPSTSLGGYFTRSPLAPLSATRRESSVALLGQPRLPSRGDLNSTANQGLLQTARLGLRATMGMPQRTFYADLFANRDQQFGMITGLDAARSLQLPLPGVPIGYVPALSASRYTPRAPATRFENLLGLTPVPTEPAVPLTTTVAERLEQRTAERAAQAEREGIALFKQATVDMRHPETLRFERCTDCNENLVRAMQRLRMASELDRQAAVPLLLMAHLALEQERPLQAVDDLLAALRRAQSVFTGAPGEFDAYFGDASATGRSAFLEMQMRRYARIAELNPGSPSAQALQAYCAWRLGDSGAAQLALGQVEQLAMRDPGRTDELLNFAAALRAVMP